MTKEKWSHKQGLYCQKCGKNVSDGDNRKNSTYLLVEGVIELLCKSCADGIKEHNKKQHGRKIEIESV